MRRLVGTVGVVCLAFALLLVGCGKFSGGGNADPFTLDYTIDESNSAFFLAGDSYATLASASPFYTGAYPVPGSNTAEFDQLRAAKVEEIKATAAQLAQTAALTSSQLETLRAAFFDGLDAGIKQDKKLAGFARGCVKELVGLQVETTTSLVLAESVIIPEQPALVKTEFEYLQVLRSMQAALAVLTEADRLVGLAAVTCNAMDKSNNAKLKSVSATLNTAMGAFDSLMPQLKSLVAGRKSILTGLDQIRTADHYLALAALDFAAEQLPKVKEQFATIKPSEKLTAEDIALSGQVLAGLEQELASARRLLEAVPADQLIPVEQETAAYGDIAWAGYAPSTSYGYGLKIFKQKEPELKRLPPKPSKTMQFAADVWTGFREVPATWVEWADLSYNYVKNVGHGVIVEGKSLDEAKEDQEQLFKDSEARFKAHKQGSHILRDAKQNIEDLENYADEATSGLVENSIGGVNVPWVAGKVAKAVVGIFTGFAKGTYALADPTSDTGELVSGGIDVACSTFGGSKVIAKPTMLKGAGQRLGAFLQKYGLKAASEGLEQVATKATTEALEATNLALKDKLKQMGAAWLKEGGATARESLNDFAKKTFEANMKGLKEAMVTMLGERGGTLVDNVVGEMIDNTLQELVVEAIKGAVDFNGTYSGALQGGAGGSITLTISGTSASGTLGGSHKKEAFHGSVSGSFDPASRKVNCKISGTLGVDSETSFSVGFAGKLSGTAAEDGSKISGSWSADNEWGSSSGSWSAHK